MKNAYDEAEFFAAYASMDRSRLGLAGAGEWYALKPLFPELKGRRVLDLGCGYGWHCAFAASEGATEVIGIDQSENMISDAKKRNPAPAVSYRVCDIERYEYPEEYFDLTVSNLVLHYIEDLNEIYRKIYKTLKQGGEFIFNIEHPVFTAGVNQQWAADKNGNLYWPVDNYYYPGKRETDFLGHKIEKYHHTLTQILDGLIQCGFSLEAVREAAPSGDTLDLPGMRDEMRRPMMLLVKARKA